MSQKNASVIAQTRATKNARSTVGLITSVSRCGSRDANYSVSPRRFLHHWTRSASVFSKPVSAGSYQRAPRSASGR